MRHRDARTRLKQKPAHARMIKRNLLTSLILYESIRTTQSRAKAIAPMIDRLVRNAKKQDVHNAIRGINKLVTDKNASRKVMEVFIKRYAKRASGLTRIKNVGSRTGDGAKLVDLTMVDSDMEMPAVEAKKVVKKSEVKKETPKKEAEESKVSHEPSKEEVAEKKENSTSANPSADEAGATTDKKKTTPKKK